MEIKEITKQEEKQKITSNIITTLTSWFEDEVARNDYIKQSALYPFFAAIDKNKPIAFIYLKPTSKHTLEIACMGMLPSNQRKGAGKLLISAAKKYAIKNGYTYLQVKTLKAGLYEEYDKTNLFYQSVGFKEFEVLNIWNEENPCQVYITHIIP